MNKWDNIFDEQILRYNTCFAALYVMNYECLKEFLIGQPKSFFCDHIEFNGENAVYKESEAYKKEVCSLDKNILDASLKWFMNLNAITQEDYDDFHNIRKKRNDITHELLKNLYEGFNEKDAILFGKLNNIYTKLDKWWINEIEIPIGMEDIPEDYDKKNVFGIQALTLSAINDIILLNQGDKYRDLLNELDTKR